MSGGLGWPEPVTVTFDFVLLPQPGRTQHRRRWRGKRMSIRSRLRDDAMGAFLAPLFEEAIAELWRRGLWGTPV